MEWNLIRKHLARAVCIHYRALYLSVHHLSLVIVENEDRLLVIFPLIHIWFIWGREEREGGKKEST